MKFSVIIPCYHSEEFVGDAIKSVQAQLFHDYELLVICESDDQASIDAVRACNVEPILGSFHSAGASRNAGLDHAKGDFILFLDSDDWFMGPDCFTVLDQFTRFRPDIMTCGFIYGERGYTSACGNGGNMYPNVWSRVWKRAYLEKHHIRFPETSWAEDVAFVQEAFSHQPEHTITDLPFVHYTYPRSGSLTAEKESGNG